MARLSRGYGRVSGVGYRVSRVRGVQRETAKGAQKAKGQREGGSEGKEASSQAGGRRWRLALRIKGGGASEETKRIPNDARGEFRRSVAHTTMNNSWPEHVESLARSVMARLER